MIGGPSQPFTLADPCPCDSGRQFRLCCRRFDGAAEIRVQSTKPVGPPTGYSHPRCYLSGTCDCSERISREHYISRAVLDLLSTQRVSGLPWQEAGVSQAFGIDALTARILCERHNSALSPLDNEAKRFVEKLRDAHSAALARAGSKRTRWRLASGEALERWGYKVLAGLVAAKIARREGVVVTPEDVSSHHRLPGLLSGQPLPAYGGLYVGPNRAGARTMDFAVAPLSDGEDVVGLVMRYGLVECTILLPTDQTAHTRMLRSGAMHRPWTVNLHAALAADGERRNAPLMLSWPDAPRREFPVLNMEVEWFPDPDPDPDPEPEHENA